jgi:pimeloyl-ACP methyl ester carboxylesterase
MGGMVAQQLAADAPARIRRLVLLATDHGGPEAVRADPDVWARLIDHSGTPREQATRLLSLIFPPEIGTAIDAQFGELVAAARAALPEDTLFAQQRALDLWYAAPHAERTARIAAPTLVVAGTEDIVIPAVNAELLAGALADATARTFPGGGHAFMEQVPQDLAAELTAFLGR